MFEGKQRLDKKLSREEIERYFKQATKDTMRFIVAHKQ
jgi:hypothetical protein